MPASTSVAFLFLIVAVSASAESTPEKIFDIHEEDDVSGIIDCHTDEVDAEVSCKKVRNAIITFVSTFQSSFLSFCRLSDRHPLRRLPKRQLRHHGQRDGRAEEEAEAGGGGGQGRASVLTLL